MYRDGKTAKLLHGAADFKVKQTADARLSGIRLCKTRRRGIVPGRVFIINLPGEVLFELSFFVLTQHQYHCDCALHFNVPSHIGFRIIHMHVMWFFVQIWNEKKRK